MTDATDARAVHENLTRDDARARASLVTDVSTRVHLDLDRGDDVFGSETELDFTLTSATSTFVDLTAVSVERAEVDGTPLSPDAIAATRLHLPELPAGRHHLRVQATMAYRHEGSGLHRFVDPSDGLVYLHSQFQPFDAHLVYACFDQPDLKTTFELSVDAPAGWVVVSNGPAIEQPTAGEAGRWAFITTPSISPYITAVVAGAYTSVHDAYVRDDGTTIDLGIYVRRSLAEHLDADEILEVTRQGFATFERQFGQRYPFGSSYDQLFVPEFSAGAMENPGCVTFSETYVFRSKVTDALRERRAETILHEMAHMWFGDLVTMRWWDDLWLNESFATFTSVHAQAAATRFRDAWITFLDAEKTWARSQDQLPSTHPVADEMPDVESVHQNFDGITYAKGASVLRQLVAWVGEDAFFAGCRDYFERHAWGNTELDDFLAALERASGRDLAGWRDEWLLTSGVNLLAPVFEVEDDRTYRSFEIVQSSPPPPWAGLEGVPVPPPVLRRHRIAVGLYDERDGAIVRTGRVELDVTGERTAVPELHGSPTSRIVIVNDDDLTYAKTHLDPGTLDLLVDDLSSIAEPLPRALLWASAWDMVRDARLPARTFRSLVLGNGQHEDQVGVLQRLQLRAIAATERYGAVADRDGGLRELADHAFDALGRAAPGSDHQLAWARHWANAARDEPHLRRLHDLLDGQLTFDGLEVDADLRWHVVIALAAVGGTDERAIDAELARDDTDLGARHAATARAALPSIDAKERAWRQLLEDTSLSHTMSRQVWTGFQRPAQDAVIEPFVARYFDVLDDVWAHRSLDWAIEFATGMFPLPAADSTLLERVDAELARDLPRPLRRVLLEQRDTLVRILDARRCDREAAERAEPVT